MGKEVTNWLLDRWLVRLGESLEGMAGEHPDIAPNDHAHGLPATALLWRHTLSLSDDAVILIRAEETLWHTVGSTVLRLAGIDNAEPEELRSTFTEIVAQSVSLLASDIGRKLGKEVTCTDSSTEDDSNPGVEWQHLSVSLAGKTQGGLAVAWGSRLLDALEPRSEVVPSPSLVPVAQPGSKPGTMDLLLEVELPVSVSFGRAQMRLKDVVKLTTGSIVELNRSISEPVEIIVNNCVIARGEVVVVEGNYGVRIKQIVSRQERLRSLF
jgi:flagellar motor switch protein FliN